MSNIVDAIKQSFTKADAYLIYEKEENRFRWNTSHGCSLPALPGVYCLISHEGQRIQKVGKADGKGGLKNRFAAYTAKKTEAKLQKDPTDRLWRTVMMGKLQGYSLELYYYVTVPIPVNALPLVLAEKVEAHWARSLEFAICKTIRQHLQDCDPAQEFMLLSGQD